MTRQNRQQHCPQQVALGRGVRTAERQRAIRHPTGEQPSLLQILDEERQLAQRRHSSTTVPLDVHPTGENVEITVTDTGEGISPEILPRVFQRFVKGPGSTGSGLGLAITHDIITAHGGTVEIQSTVGSGTTVRITLPPATA